MWQVLRTAGFIAFLIMAFLNAFVDLGHKILIQNTIFKTYDGQEQIILTAIVNALILLPFVMVFTPAGFFSDKYPKNQVMRYSAWAALGLTLLITLSYYQGWFWFGFAMTFLLALQSALYSPAKFGYIKEIVGESKLPQGNALTQSTIIVAILFSTFFFSILFEQLLGDISYTDENDLLTHIAPLGWVLIGLTLLELWFAYRIPQTRPTDPSMHFDWHDYLTGTSLRTNLKRVSSNRIIILTVLGLAIFWSVSQVILAAFPNFAKDHLTITNTAVVQGLMACSGIGIMIGSLLAGRISRTHIETGLIPVGAIGLLIGVALITWLDSTLLQALNFLFIGIMGGLFMIPMSALMQYHTPTLQLGRVLAGYNLIKTLIMLAFLGLTIFVAYHGLDSIHIFHLLTAVMLIGALATMYYLPHSLLRFIISRLFHARYRLKVLGFEHLPANGGVLMLGNHISWIDWALVQMASPRPLRFVMEKGYYERWYLKGVLKLFGVVPISGSASAESLQEITKLLEQGEVVCLFPEGTISRTGQLSEFKRGYEKAVRDTDAVIIPFYLHGLWGSRFSRSSGFLRQNRQSGFKRDIIVAFGKALPNNTPAYQLKQHIFDLSFASWQRYSSMIDPLAVSWLKSAKRQGSKMAASDVIGDPVSYHRFMTAVFRFAALIRKQNSGQNVGLLLPTSVGSAIANMAVFTLGKTVVNINYTASASAIQGALQQAKLPHLFTSKRFIRKLQERGIDIPAILPDTPLIYLEDLKASIPKWQLLTTLLMVNILPTFILEWLYIKHVNQDDTAAILFSSGSEGTPKGVELSHRNLAINARQVADTLNTLDNDVIMGTLPAFHAFGLTASMLMPLSEGIPIVCHPDPTDAMNIAKGVAKYDATVLFGTATFLRLYARNKKIHPLMFQSLRYVVAGAEKLPQDVRELFLQRFGKQVLEGYGATETSPVASVNMPDQLDTRVWKVQAANRPGTVGLPIPGTSFRIVDPDTLKELHTGEDGLILIGGPQVMKGYLHNPAKTDEVIAERDGQRWYKTGDKGHVDEDGFLTIVDRYSRFAKLGGEMVSLTAVEQAVRQALNDPELGLVAVNLPDAKKGEKVILLISGEHEPKSLRKQLVASGMNPLMIPSDIHVVAEVPKLGSGKTDFATARKLAESLN